MAQEGDIVFMIGADVAGLTRAGQAGERSLADMEKAAKDLERQIGKIGSAGVQFQREMNALTGVTRDLGKSARDSAAAFEAFDKSKAQVDALRASIDPLFAASKRYEQALGTLDTALEQGTISARQHEAMVEQLSAAYLRADGAATAMGSRVGFLGSMTDQTRGKIQQVGFQVQDFAVQVGAGTSATQAFAQQFPQLAGAFGPVGVAIGTLAAVGIPLLVAAFGSASAASDELAEAAKRQEAALKGVLDMTERLRLENEMAQSGRETIEEQRLANEINELLRQRSEIIRKLNEDYTSMSRAAGIGAQTVADAKKQELTAQLVANEAALRDLEAQRTRNRHIENAKKLSEAYKSVLDAIAQGNISGPWQAVLGAIDQAIEKANEYRAAMENATPGNRARDGEDGRGGQGEQRASAAQFRGDAIRDQLFSTGAGGGGGGGGGENPMVAQLEALRQQMMTEEQIELESYARRQEMLAQALDQQLLTQQEYAALMQRSQQEHSDKMSDIDVYRYGTGLDKASAFFGEMASAMQGGNEEMLKISKAFGAAQALISAWQGAAEALKLPFPSNIAAFAKVLATGLGAVNAIKGAKKGGTTSGAGAGGGAAAAPAASPVQTMNLSFTNDPWGSTEKFARQMAVQLNEAQRNGMIVKLNVI